MNQETINAIKEALIPVAEKIGQGAEYGWEIVVRQQYVFAVEGLLAALLGGLVLWKWIVPMAKKLIKADIDPIVILPIAFLGIPAIAGVVFGTMTAIERFINPHYYAIQFFIGLVK